MAGRLTMRLQRGAALIIFAVALVMGVLTYLVNSFSPESVEAQRQQKTQAALIEARDALLGYALQYRDVRAAQDANFDGDDDRAMYGFLPMPDVGTDRFNAGQQNPACNTEGCAMDFINGAFPAQNETIIGRLPWRTLGIGPLRDGHGECLWYAVSAGHKNLAIDTALTMNWDTLGQLDQVVVTAGALAAEGLAGHQRPVAMIFSPGAALGGRSASAAVTSECGGNYVVTDYLEAPTLLIPNFATVNGASGDTSIQPKPLSTKGKLGSGTVQLANDTGIAITSDALFGAIRKRKFFRDDLKNLLNRMAKCWSKNIATLAPVAIAGVAPADKVAGRMPDPPVACSTDPNSDPSTRYGDDYDPKGYFNHYRDQVFIARPNTGTFTVNGDSTCTGVILFSGPRTTSQERHTASQKTGMSNYLEGTNLNSFTGSGTTFSGDATTSDAPPQANGADIAICIPPPVPPTLVTSPTLAAANQLVAYNAATHTLTLGKLNIDSAHGYADSALFGCAWMESSAIGNGVRIYFKFRFKILGTSVGTNGLVLAMADAETNSTLNCGMAGSHLGYSGNNGLTPKITWPKIGIEFDQGRNTGFPGAGESSVNAGRNDPCGTTAFGCAGFGYNSHAAIVYWGNAAANAADLVTLPDNDDNVHGLPATPPASRPPPSNPGYPSTGFAFKNFRGQATEGGDSYLYHVRIELTPTRAAASDAKDSHTVMQTQVWILADSVTVANQIVALQNTTRPMNNLYPSYSPDLQQSATLYDVGTDRSACANCLSGETCGSDNICYRPPLRNLQLGFTNAQRTSDQQVDITGYSATWIP
jgi:type II secretory pathway pseudopilin PulG